MGACDFVCIGVHSCIILFKPLRLEFFPRPLQILEINRFSVLDIRKNHTLLSLSLSFSLCLTRSPLSAQVGPG